MVSRTSQAARLLFALMVVLGMAVSCAAPAQQTEQKPAAPKTDSTQTQAEPASQQPSQKQEPGKPKYGGTLTVGQDIEPDSLMPNFITGSPMGTNMVVENIYENLIRFDPELKKMGPGLAESWESSDAQTWVLHLKKGVKFHDGKDFEAEDVIYSLQRMQDPKIGGQTILQGAKIEEIDKHTVKVVLTGPNSTFLSRQLGSQWAIVSKGAAEKYDLKNQANGTGPFKLAEFVPGSHVKLAKFENYHVKGLPYLDAVLYKFITDESTRLAAIRSGTVDITRFYDPKNAQLIRNDKNIVAVDTGTLTQDFFWLNMKKKPFDDIRVRQAISLALDRQQLVDAVMYGEVKPQGILPNGFGDWVVPMSELPNMKQDTVKARKLLADAGYPDGFKMSIKVFPAQAQGIASAQVMKEQLKAVGIDVEVVVLEWGVQQQHLVKGDYDMAHTPQPTATDPDAYLYDRYHSKYPRNRGGYSNPKLDKLLEEARASLDDKRRHEIYAEVQKIVAEEVPVIIPLGPPRYDPYRTYVKGFVPMLNASRITLRETWLDK